MYIPQTRREVLSATLVLLLVSCVRAADDSSFESTDGTDVGTCVVAVVASLVGAGIFGFSDRFMAETVFAIGFALGAVSIATTMDHLLVDQQTFRGLGFWAAFIGGGAGCGGMARWVYPKSRFITGIAGGTVLAVLLTNSVAWYICPGQTSELFTLLCLLLAVVFASLALKYGQPVEIVATTIAGAAVFVWGLGYFIGGFPLPNDPEKYASRNADGDFEYAIPALWWAYLGGIATLSALGMVIHYRKTRHTDSGNELAADEVTGGGFAMDTALDIETEKQRLTIPVMDQSANSAWESDFLPSSYPSVVHQSFCRLYSRNTEAEAISKMRSNFLETRASEAAKGTAVDDARALL